jgi:anti-sigma-K factor RskA
MTEIHALSGAYAVGAVDDVERAQFERHLAECADCRAEVDSLREAAAVLAEDTAMTPPPALRDRVLAGIATVRPLPPVTPTGPTRPDVIEQADPIELERSRGPRRWLPALAAAVVLAVVGIGAVAWQPWNQSTSQLTLADQVLQAPDAQAVSLEFPGGAKATVTASKSEGRAVITTEKMPPAPEGKVYELWLQRPDGSMEPAGVMPPVPDQTLVLDGDVTAAVGAGITVEPAGGSDEPTGEPIALFEFPEAT